jgi:hypothetical protein
MSAVHPGHPPKPLILMCKPEGLARMNDAHSFALAL